MWSRLGVGIASGACAAVISCPAEVRLAQNSALHIPDGSKMYFSFNVSIRELFAKSSYCT